jgi:CRP/FNR family cyclic AMP-dependent transcriptional regulator
MARIFPLPSVRADIIVPEKDTTEETRHLLGNCVLFSGLSTDERMTIAARARIRTVAPGETVFAIGSPGDQMMAVLSGNIRISVPSSDGKELLLAIIQPGEVFGELSVLDGKERSADAIAENACTLASCPLSGDLVAKCALWWSFY